MGNETRAGNKRRPYKKPQIEQVKLVAEEAVLKSCKTAVVLGPGNPGDPCIKGCSILAS